MGKKKEQPCCEQFKTKIGGQALIEGIMMRGPDKDAVIVRGKDGLDVQIRPRKQPPKGSPLRWVFVRGVVNFFDAQVTGVKAIMHSADLSPEETAEEPSKLDAWLEKKMGSERFQNFLMGTAVALGLGMSILLFFLLPMIVGGFFDRWIKSNLAICLVEGVIRIGIFLAYMFAVSRMQEMKRIFAYHGAEHKTIRCYEAGLPLTVENVRKQTRLHPRCGTSFLLVVLVLSILVYSIASSALLAAVPALEAMRGSFAYRFVMVVFKLLLLPLVVAIAYEINRCVGGHDNLLSRILRAPGMWFQNFTTNEPDDSMIEVGIAALEAVIPEEAGADAW